MRIRLKTGLAGPLYRGGPGDILDLDEAEALRLLDAGYAEAPEPEKPKPVTKPKPAKS